ncbi:MAG: WG repeat-containing protein [Oscillospiraceae bacterium]|nr:WG repeat-containing protein [Oscillospiraceae bacterium]
MKKKLISIVLAVFMVTAILPATVSATNGSTIKKVASGLEYGSIYNFSEGLALVSDKATYNYGYIDTTGKLVVPCIYDYALSFSEGLATVRKDGKCGYIDKTGNVVIPFMDVGIAYEFHNGIAMMIDKNGYGVWIDKTGKEVRSTNNADNWLTVVQKDGKWGYIDETGKEVVPCIYDNVIILSDGFAVQKDDKWGYIDKTGKLVLPCIYDSIDYNNFKDGLVLVQKDGKYGYIDETDKEVIPCVYDNAVPFSEGLAAVADETGSISIGMGREDPTYSWGFINTNGEIVIPLMYDNAGSVNGGYNTASSFNEGVANVIKDGKMGTIDQTGKVVVPFKYDYIYPFKNGLAVVVIATEWIYFGDWGKISAGKMGIINKTGKPVLPCDYYSGIDIYSNQYFYNDIFDSDTFPWFDKNAWEIFEIQSEIEQQSDAAQYYIPWLFITYAKPDFKSQKMGTFSPQTVTAIQMTDEGWALIDTYNGEYWVYITDNSRFIDKSIQIYDNKGDSNAIATIPPQVVEIISQDGNWLQIDTWLGPKWINLS